MPTKALLYCEDGCWTIERTADLPGYAGQSEKDFLNELSPPMQLRDGSCPVCDSGIGLEWQQTTEPSHRTNGRGDD